MARIDVLMPQMGESIAEGTLSKWLKKVGDAVKRDEPLFEISTDKVDAEIPAPSAGFLAEIKVQEGQTVPVQTLVAVIDTEKAGSAPAAPSSAAAPSAAAPRAPAASGATASGSAAKPTAPPPPPPSTVVHRPSPSSTAVGQGDGADDSMEDRLRKKSTPLVRKIAAEHQVDITTIPGTGFAGRVTKQDILGYIEKGEPARAAPPSAAAPPRAPVASGATAPGGAGADPWPGDRVEPMSKIRRITADHMIMSRRVSAHVTSFFEIDYTRIAQLRARHKASYTERGVNLTYLAFITKVCAEHLRKHRVVNAAVSGENIVYRADVNIGIAVALDWGLIVPVIKHADELSLIGVARALADLGERARTKKLSPDEIQRGTFTITNPGVFGSYVGVPIINQPQVAILGVGAIEKRPKVVTLPDGTDTVAVRTMGMLSMSYDHRIVDGADADRFLADVKASLQDFPEGAV